MEIHRYERAWLAASLVLIVLFIGTVAYGALGPSVAMVDAEGGTVDPAALDDHPRFSDPGVYQTGEDEYAAYVIARRFAFQPGSTDPIRVPEGSTVTFYITSPDVVHGFSLAGTNVNTMVLPGQVTKVTVDFEETGEYGVVCHEYCGEAHHEMAGTLVVVPSGEFDLPEERDVSGGGS